MQKSMKLFLVMITCFMLLLSACSTSSAKEDSEKKENVSSDEFYNKLKEKGVIQIGSTPTGPPFNFLNVETNEIDGLMIDIAERIGEELDLKVQKNSVQWSSLIPTLEGGKIDMIVSALAITDERAEVIDFSEPVYTYNEVIVISKDNNDIKSFEDLKGKTVGVQLATINHTEIVKYPEINVLTYKTQQDMAKELGFGRIDAFMADYPIYQHMTKELPDLADQMKFAPDHEPQWFAEFAIGLPKGTEEFQKKVNKIILEMKDSGELDELISKWEIE